MIRLSYKDYFVNNANETAKLTLNIKTQVVICDFEYLSYNFDCGYFQKQCLRSDSFLYRSKSVRQHYAHFHYSVDTL